MMYAQSQTTPQRLDRTSRSARVRPSSRQIETQEVTLLDERGTVIGWLTAPRDPVRLGPGRETVCVRPVSLRGMLAPACQVA